MPRSVFAVRLLSAFIYFLAQMDLRFEIIRNLEFEIWDLTWHVWLSSKGHPPSKSGGLDCPSWVRVLPHAPRRISDCELRISNWNLAIIRAVLHRSAIRNSQSEILLWKGSLTGKAVVPKTTALVACRFDSCPFRQFRKLEASPNGMAAVC